METVEARDPFVLGEAEPEVDEETRRVLEKRIKAADEGRLVSAAAARGRLRRWLSKSSIKKTH